jgi:hypothetical protein
MKNICLSLLSRTIDLTLTYFSGKQQKEEETKTTTTTRMCGKEREECEWHKLMARKGNEKLNYITLLLIVWTRDEQTTDDDGRRNMPEN